MHEEEGIWRNTENGAGKMERKAEKKMKKIWHGQFEAEFCWSARGRSAEGEKERRWMVDGGWTVDRGPWTVDEGLVRTGGHPVLPETDALC